MMSETDETQQLTIFITGAGQGVGLAATTLAVRAGYKVIGTTDLGSTGAYRIRHAGGVPIYPDLTRESALYSALQMAKADVIIHAAPQRVNGIPQHTLDYDEAFTWLQASTDALMTAAGRADIQRVIHISAASIYGDTHHEAVKEDAHLDLSNALGKALLEAEETVLDGGVPAYILRAGHIVGTHQAGAEIAKALLAGKGMPSGKHATVWVHEDDVASAALILAERDDDSASGSIYNIAGDETPSPDEFMRQFGETYGTGAPGALADFLLQLRTSPTQRALMSFGTLVDTGKAREELGWQPQFTLAKALDKMLLLWTAEDAQVTVYHQEDEADASAGIVKT
ncbi:MAG: NAD-dependent epimerase/dehydratase family protein [Anaerolineae bacterium]